MNPPSAQSESAFISLPRAILFAAGAILAFNLAYSIPQLSFLIVIYLACLFELSRVKSGRQAFYLGLLTALGCYAPQTDFIWTIFGAAAIPLWLILAIWIALFLVLTRLCRIRYGKLAAALLAPFLWTGLEYFRSELYYLRFSWLNPGYSLSGQFHLLPFNVLGVYGIGFVLMAAISFAALLSKTRRRIIFAVLLLLLAINSNWLGRLDTPRSYHGNRLQIAGIQFEFPEESEVVRCLDRLVKEYPDAQLLVLSEYTFAGPLPDRIKKWCAANHRYLVIGAKDPVAGDEFYDTAFVIGPCGEIVFRQGKCVPIQFFKDGLPAREQKLWESPWGKIGFCICYDLSYTRVTDELVRLGARAIIVPTMDIVEWGRHQHEMHARVAPIRSAEYGLPIFRLASSGISQYVEPDGMVNSTAPMPGAAATLFGNWPLDQTGTLPWDRRLAPVCVGITGLTAVWLLLCNFRKPGTLVQNPQS